MRVGDCVRIVNVAHGDDCFYHNGSEGVLMRNLGEVWLVAIRIGEEQCRTDLGREGIVKVENLEVLEMDRDFETSVEADGAQWKATWKGIERQLRQCKLEDGECCKNFVFVGPDENGKRQHWEGCVLLDQGSYMGGLFFFDVYFPTQFPFAPPKIFFRTRIYHYAVNLYDGEVTMACLKPLAWAAAMDIHSNTMQTVLMALHNELVQPSQVTSSCFQDSLLAQQFLHDRQTYDMVARRWTLAYGMGGSQVTKQVRGVVRARAVLVRKRLEAAQRIYTPGGTGYQAAAAEFEIASSQTIADRGRSLLASLA